MKRLFLLLLLAACAPTVSFTNDPTKPLSTCGGTEQIWMFGNTELNALGARRDHLVAKGTWIEWMNNQAYLVVPSDTIDLDFRLHRSSQSRLSIRVQGNIGEVYINELILFKLIGQQPRSCRYEGKAINEPATTTWVFRAEGKKGNR